MVMGGLHTAPVFADGRPYFQGFDPCSVPSPCFVVDRAAIDFNLQILRKTADAGNFKILAALKAFSCFAVFDQLRAALDGACASGLHEARLARETIDREVHVFSPAYTAKELRQLLETADHIVFNNLTQWRRFQAQCLAAETEQREPRRKAGREALSFGIRINPEHSEGTTPIYDPCAPLSRLGITRAGWDAEFASVGGGDADVLAGISGLHFHSLCEQGAEPLARTLGSIQERWGDVLRRPQIRWFNMGGGHHITKPDYRRDLLVNLACDWARLFGVQVYLEPGEAVAIHSGVLVASVLDVHQNGMPQVILDTSATCHMPDTLEMPYTPEIWGAEILAGTPPYDVSKGWSARLGGQTCLAGDVIGDYGFAKPLAIGERVIFDDMAHYTMVKTSTFNGIGLPAIAIYDSRTGNVTLVKEFGYSDFRDRLS
ncbi:MAG: carboxynorspermidine decarboxylase [Kiritimatiellia bacterium]